MILKNRHRFSDGPIVAQERDHLDGLSRPASVARALIKWLRNRRYVERCFDQALREIEEEKRAGTWRPMPSPEEHAGMQAFHAAAASHKGRSMRLRLSRKYIKLRSAGRGKRSVVSGNA